MKKILFLLVLFSLLISSSEIALAQTLVTNLSDLQAMQFDLDDDYILDSDIDMTGFDFSPIGNNTTPFNGTFDGNGHTITNLSINRPDDPYVGLFGKTTSDAHINDVTLVNFDIVGRAYGGGIAGWNNGMITDVTVSGDVSARSNIGTVAGRNYGSIINAHGSGKVTITSSTGLQVGGLVGLNKGGSIADSSFKGDVIGALKAGGFVGSNRDGGLIEHSFNTGSINNNPLTVQGSMGRLGGFAGQNFNGSTIINCYSNADVTNKRDTTGGFVGLNYNNSSIINSYSSGDVWGLNGYGIGGFVGESYGSVSVASFWDMDTQTHGVMTSAGGTGLSTTAMQTKSTFLNAGWDFANIWIMIDYPRFQSEVSIQTILDFFDASVDDGTLVGEGKDQKDANKKLEKLRKILEKANGRINAGETEKACKELEKAFLRCDGQPKPKDNVSGSAAPTLSLMIQSLRDSLGCH